MTDLRCLGSGSSGNCYLLRHDGKTLILDAGIRWKDIGPHVTPLRDVAGCIVTHAHKDHVLAADDMKRNGINVFQPYDRAETMRVQEMPPFRVTSFPVPHDGEPCVGYYITFGDERMIYATDFEYIKYNFRGLRPTVLLIECNHMDDVDGENKSKLSHVILGHASISVTESFVTANKTDALKLVILCHLSYANADEAEIKKRIRAIVGGSTEVAIAHKGNSWIIGD